MKGTGRMFTAFWEASSRLISSRASRLVFALALAVAFMATAPISVIALDSTVTVSGTVKDNQANPFPGAEVQAIDPATPGVVASDLTDSSGYYTLSIAPGTYDIKAVPPEGSDFGPAIAPGRVFTSDTTLNFVLVPAGKAGVSGRVLDPLGNSGIPNQEVGLAPEGTGNWTYTTTDDLGNYFLEVAPGNYTIEVRGSNYPAANASRFYYFYSVISLEESITMDIPLPMKRVSVHVQDPAGNPVANVGITTSEVYIEQNLPLGFLTASGMSYYPFWMEPWVTTNASGDIDLWLFPTPPGDTYTVTATPPPGSPFVTFSVQDIQVISDMTIIVVLDFVHASPVTTASLSPAPDEQGIYREPVTVTVSATAAEGFTVDATYYRVDGGPTQTYAEPFVIYEDGTHTLEYWSVDNVGVYEIPNTLSLDILSNQPPVANAGGPYSVPEGGSVPLSGSGSDPDGDPLTYSWDLDDDGTFETPGQNPTFSAVGRDGPSSQTVVLQVCDDKDACDTSSDTVDITNVAPTIAPSGGASVDEGSLYTLTLGAVTDPGDDAVTDYIVHWGDATTDTYTSGGDVTHTYADGDAPQTISVDLVDEDGTHEDAGSLSLTVINVAPTVGEITAPVDPVAVGTPITATALFTDPSPVDTHTGEWDWGDVTTSGTVTEANGSGSVTDSHTYTLPGVYTITLTVTDDDGGVGSAVYHYVVVYDPEGGFVTGGGWIDSPAGAYAPDPSLTGKATFGFVSKYKKGATVLTGQTEFQFRVADLNFHSTAYDWLVIAGARAQYKGSGTINGEGNCGFMLTAIDAELTPSAEVDKFRIKIWDKDNGDAIVYDNQMGDADDADLSTEIGGGSIVIHNK